MLGSAEHQARALLDDARRQAETTRREAAVEARDEALRLRQGVEAEATKLRAEVEVETRTRLAEVQQREERMAGREESLDAKATLLDRREVTLHDREEALEATRAELELASEEHRRRLEQVAAMTAAEAKAMLVKQIEEDAKRDAMGLVRDLEQQAREEADRRSRKIVTLAIQRVASEQTSESTVSVLPLPSDDMKGRIIGREGRNIRAFEAVTGVNLIIDDTPEAVLLSCFDPVRREIGRLTLEKLVSDGRIHPARIEETYDRAKQEVEGGPPGRRGRLPRGRHHRPAPRAGPRARAAQVPHLLRPERAPPPDRDRPPGRHHGLRAGHGRRPGQAVRVPARHRQGPHPRGRGLARHHRGRAGPPAQGAARGRPRHRGPPRRGRAADHRGRPHPGRRRHLGRPPGARRETLESYVKRLERLEEIAGSYPGVDKVFAMQAGREVRIMVKPEDVDDVAAQVLARDMAKRVEQELQYPGQIKITVVREIRSIEYAK